MEECYTIDVRLYVGGRFEIVSGKSQYIGGQMNLMTRIPSTSLTYDLLAREAKTVVGEDVNVFLWHRKCGIRTIIIGDRDLPEVLKSRDKNNRLDIYVTTRARQKLPPHLAHKYRSRATKQSNKGSSMKSSKPKAPVTSPLRKSPSLHSSFDAPLDILPLNVIPVTKPQERLKLPIRRPDPEDIIVDDWTYLEDEDENEDEDSGVGFEGNGNENSGVGFEGNGNEDADENGDEDANDDGDRGGLEHTVVQRSRRKFLEKEFNLEADKDDFFSDESSEDSDFGT